MAPYHGTELILDPGTATAVTGATIWTTWNTTATMSATYPDSIWRTWTTTAASTEIIVSDTTNTAIWVNFVHDHNQVLLVREQTEQQRLAEEERRREAQARYQKRQEEQKAAQLRAELLLKETLDQVQKAQYEKFGYFFVQGHHSGKTYRIRKGRSINIDVMDGQKVLNKLCAHPDIHCPNEDTMLVQKIMLEHNEQEFLRKAIVH